MLGLFGLIGVYLLVKGFMQTENNIDNVYNMFFAKYEIADRSKVALIQKYSNILLGISFIVVTLLNAFNIVTGYTYVNIAIIVLSFIHLLVVRKYLRKVTN